MKIEFHSWPPHRYGGQHVRQGAGILAVDTETGVAVVVTSERSQRANQVLAEERVGLLVAALPWSTRY